jgi:hypothetical protein
MGFCWGITCKKLTEIIKSKLKIEKSISKSAGMGGWNTFLCKRVSAQSFVCKQNNFKEKLLQDWKSSCFGQDCWFVAETAPLWTNATSWKFGQLPASFCEKRRKEEEKPNQSKLFKIFSVAQVLQVSKPLICTL